MLNRTIAILSRPSPKAQPALWDWSGVSSVCAGRSPPGVKRKKTRGRSDSLTNESSGWWEGEKVWKDQGRGNIVKGKE